MQEPLLKYRDVMESESLGTLFAQARSARGWDQKYVASRLRFDSKIIAALEDDAYADLGAPVFARSYVTRYARLLGLPEGEIVERYRQVAPAEPPPLRVSSAVKNQVNKGDGAVRWFAYSVLLAGVLYLGALGLDRVSNYFEDSETQQLATLGDGGSTSLSLPTPPASSASAAADGRSGQPAKTDAMSAAGGTPSAMTPVQSESLVSDKPNSIPDPAQVDVPVAVTGTDAIKKPGVEDAGAGAASERATADTTSAEAAPESAESGSAADADVARLVITLTEDCWADIKDADGNSLAYGVLKANTTHIFQGRAPFKLTLGNAVAATIKLNGDTVDRGRYIPRRGTVSRFVLGESTAGA